MSGQFVVEHTVNIKDNFGVAPSTDPHELSTLAAPINTRLHALRLCPALVDRLGRLHGPLQLLKRQRVLQVARNGVSDYPPDGFAFVLDLSGDEIDQKVIHNKNCYKAGGVLRFLRMPR